MARRPAMITHPVQRIQHVFSDIGFCGLRSFGNTQRECPVSGLSSVKTSIAWRESGTRREPHASSSAPPESATSAPSRSNSVHSAAAEFTGPHERVCHEQQRAPSHWTAVVAMIFATSSPNSSGLCQGSEIPALVRLERTAERCSGVHIGASCRDGVSKHHGTPTSAPSAVQPVPRAAPSGGGHHA